MIPFVLFLAHARYLPIYQSGLNLILVRARVDLF